MLAMPDWSVFAGPQARDVTQGRKSLHLLLRTLLPLGMGRCQIGPLPQPGGGNRRQAQPRAYPCPESPAKGPLDAQQTKENLHPALTACQAPAPGGTEADDHAWWPTVSLLSILWPLLQRPASCRTDLHSCWADLTLVPLPHPSEACSRAGRAHLAMSPDETEARAGRKTFPGQEGIKAKEQLRFGSSLAANPQSSLKKDGKSLVGGAAGQAPDAQGKHTMAADEPHF